MTPTQQDLIRTTWQRLIAERQDSAELFHTQLFQLEPRLRAVLCPPTATQNNRSLIWVLDLAVRGLAHWQAVQPALQDLGRRYAAQGLTAADYGSVALALLATVSARLDADFTPEVRFAWTEFHAQLTAAMLPLSPSAARIAV